ncbi:hypothetical protein [Vibrio splendidus]|uniref:hypothetical protein n=1 Tax=Vibrio splendidus TaxID=29497 RepID=UPI0000671085|nr:hypothetical protein [Vibrio splendidus]EAP92951.1 hypothetical protein V12B01_20932 [Vibrio splendidus 12B01]
MNDQILVEIRDSLNEIKALASPIMVMNADGFTPEQEQELKDSLSKSRGGLFVSPQPAEALALKQKLMSGLNADREVFDIVHAINVLAMAHADVIHIFTRYSAHVNRLSVDVEPLTTNYYSCNGKREKLLMDDVRIDEEDALEQLLSIESKLTELIIEAREEAETNVEVEA